MYVLEAGKKRWIQTAEDFTKLGFSWNAITVLPAASDTYQNGEIKTLTRGQITSQFVHTLMRGSRGAEVLALQQKLKDLGFFPVDVEMIPYFGPATQKVVKVFQKVHGLAQVGVVGPQTRALLNK